VADPEKDGWKSTTMVNGEQSVMTTSTIEMRQLPVINWDSGKSNIQHILSQIDSHLFVVGTSDSLEFGE